jgi:hypothetical protein
MTSLFSPFDVCRPFGYDNAVWYLWTCSTTRLVVEQLYYHAIYPSCLLPDQVQVVNTSCSAEDNTFIRGFIEAVRCRFRIAAKITHAAKAKALIYVNPPFSFLPPPGQIPEKKNPKTTPTHTKTIFSYEIINITALL